MESTYSIPQKESKIRKGPWTPEEDSLLINYISFYGEGRWDALAKGSGLQQNGKSCRLRWVNYLRPGLKGTKLSKEEKRLVIDLHQKWGNRWSRIARYLPRRTDNEIENFFRNAMGTQIQEYAGFAETDLPFPLRKCLTLGPTATLSLINARNHKYSDIVVVVHALVYLKVHLHVLISTTMKRRAAEFRASETNL